MSVNTTTRTESAAYWQDAPCPHWCEARHMGGDRYADRHHYGEALDRPLSTENPVEGYEYGTREADFLRLYLDQHYRECEPRVWVDRNEGATEYRLTLDEAEQLARTLLLLVAQARS